MNKKAVILENKIRNARQYEVDFNQGLNDNQVQERKDDGLVNKLIKTHSKTYFEIIFKNIFSILNIILIAVAVVLTIFKLYNRMFFVILLLINTTISLVQDIKARHLVDKLSLISNPKVSVIRNGKEFTLPFNQLVLSDIIVLRLGDTVPCDSVILSGELRVNESFLTGESIAVKKIVNDKVYAESSVMSGSAYAKIVKVANANYASKLQEKSKTFSRPKSEILSSLNKIITFLSISSILLAVALIIVNVCFHVDVNDWIDSVTSGIVMMIPAGMYLTISIALTVGIIHLAKKNILVKEMYSIEMLARVDTLCLDKTGTITSGKMELDEIVSFKKYTVENIKEYVSKMVFVTNDVNLTANAIRKNIGCLKVAGETNKIQFDSEAKFSAATFEGITIALGAHGFIKIDNDKEILSAVKKYELKGDRVMILAKSNKKIVNGKLPNDMTCIGVISMCEEIKEDAIKNIKWFQDNGVSIKVISGDSQNSLQTVAKKVGIENADKVCSLEGLSDEEICTMANKYNVFARVLPEQKKLLIEGMRNNKKTVAMVGDGVNDILALKQADCSIAMANGADAAKGVSHLISMDSNFSSLPKVVEEGRRVINNLQRVCSIFLVKTFFSITMSLLFLILNLFSPDQQISSPFISNYFIVWELLTIGLAPLLLAIEPNIKRISSDNFLSSIFKVLIPAGCAQVVVALPLVILCTYKADLFPKDCVMPLVAILITVMSFVILVNICWPLNKYRGTVCGVTFLLMGVAFFLDYIFYFSGLRLKGKSLFLSIDYNVFATISTPAILIGVLTFVGVAIIYCVNNYFARKKRNLK